MAFIASLFLIWNKINLEIKLGILYFNFFPNKKIKVIDHNFRVFKRTKHVPHCTGTRLKELNMYHTAQVLGDRKGTSFFQNYEKHCMASFSYYFQFNYTIIWYIYNHKLILSIPNSRFKKNLHHRFVSLYREGI